MKLQDYDIKHRLTFPEKVMPIFTPAPFKVIEGGRGKGASWSFARAALLMGAKRPLFIVCAREIQRSIKESVHKLLSDQIVNMRYHEHRDEQGKFHPAFYQVLDTEIRGTNGTRFVFVGLNNIDSIKSMEGIDILWVTEARRVPKSKWNVLLPTVRNDPPKGPFQLGSEIWVDLNPELSSDDTFKMFVADPPADAIVIHMDYRDNPYFPAFLQKQMEEMRTKDPDEWRTVWRGHTRKALQGAIFAKEIETGVRELRIGPSIKWMPERPVIATFDLGDSDVTAMWVWQQIGNEHNCIDYEEETGKDIAYFLRLLQERKYLVKGVWLPHDAEQQHQAARPQIQNTITKQAKALFPLPGVVKVVPNVSETLQIAATRALFPRVNINDVVCSRGVMCLQNFAYEVHPHTGERSKSTKHNWASHGAKGFMYYAVQLTEGRKKERDDDLNDTRTSRSRNNTNNSWMGR